MHLLAHQRREPLAPHGQFNVSEPLPPGQRRQRFVQRKMREHQLVLGRVDREIRLSGQPDLNRRPKGRQLKTLWPGRHPRVLGVVALRSQGADKLRRRRRLHTVRDTMRDTMRDTGREPGSDSRPRYALKERCTYPREHQLHVQITDHDARQRRQQQRVGHQSTHRVVSRPLSVRLQRRPSHGIPQRPERRIIHHEPEYRPRQRLRRDLLVGREQAEDFAHQHISRLQHHALKHGGQQMTQRRMRGRRRHGIEEQH